MSLFVKRVFPIIWKTTSEFHPHSLKLSRFPRMVLNTPRCIFGFSNFDRDMRSVVRTMRQLDDEFLRFPDIRLVWRDTTIPWGIRHFLGRPCITSAKLTDYIIEEGGVKKLKIQFDISSFKPEDIEIKTVKNKLIVNAKLRHKSDNQSIYQEYTQEYSLPEGVDPLTVTSNWSEDGSLVVEAPYNIPEIEPKATVKEIPVKHE